MAETIAQLNASSQRKSHVTIGNLYADLHKEGGHYHNRPMNISKHAFFCNVALCRRPLLFLVALSCCMALSHGEELFTTREIVVEKLEPLTIRGVINSIEMPVPDAVGLVSVRGGYFLFTTDSYDIHVTYADDQKTVVRNQSMFHLTGEDKIMIRLNALLGKPVEVRATPFGRSTRHHLTPVLLYLESVKELKSAK